MPQENSSQQLLKLQNQFDTLKTELGSIKNDLEEHQHTGSDGSIRITDADIVLKEKHAILVGPGGITSESDESNTATERKILYLVCGPTGINSGILGKESKNMQLMLDYSSGNNFIYALSRGIGTACSIVVTSTQTTLTDTSMDFGEDDSRVGQYIAVQKEATTVGEITQYGYLITANTKHSITISTGFGFDGRINWYVVHIPTYLGSSLVQWKKLRTLDGIGFGPGQPYNGQNGLLYMDTDGTLKFRDTDDNISTLSDTGLTGSIMLWGAATAPDGYLLCNGAAVSRSTYSTLYGIISTTYGVGDGSTTFNVPDLRGRVPVGKSTDTEFDVLGENGGEKTHQLTVGELAVHSHSIVDNAGIKWAAGAGSGHFYGTADPHFVSTSIGNAGSNTPHNNLQPYITLNYIIKF